MLTSCFVLLLVINSLLSCSIPIWNPFLQRNHLSALILARGGSKSIPLKNLALVGNVSLLERSIFALKASKSFDSIWVSTDNEKIANTAIEANVNVHVNSGENFQDKSSSIQAVKYFLKYRKEIDILALVQCTSPFLKSTFLNRAVQAVYSEEECAFSVTKNVKLHWYQDKLGVFPMNFDHKNRPRRQDISGQYTENGMFYFATRQLLLNGFFQTKR